MNITVNGTNKTFQDLRTVQDLLQTLKLQPETVVVELNATIIQPDSYDSTNLAVDDQVEIIRFVGGG